jgi:hypothetical protein
MVSFTPWPLYPGKRVPGTHWIGCWMGPRTGLDDMEKRKFLTLPGLDLQPLGRAAHSLSLYRLSCLLMINIMFFWDVTPCSMTQRYKSYGGTRYTLWLLYVRVRISFLHFQTVQFTTSKFPGHCLKPLLTILTSSLSHCPSQMDGRAKPGNLLAKLYTVSSLSPPQIKSHSPFMIFS